MLKEKHKGYISVITIVLLVIFVITSVFFTGNSKNAVATGAEVSDVLDKNKVTKINIDIDEKTWDSLIENALYEEYVNADITIDDEKFHNIGIRAKGNSTLTRIANNSETDRFSFKVNFSKYVDGQTYHGIEKLALNNMMSDTTYLKEYLSYDIYSFLGIATPEYSYADISINGESWGLYLALEVMEERFIEKNYGELEGNLYKPESMDMGGNKNGGAGDEGGQKPEMQGGDNPMPADGERTEIPNGEVPSLDGENPEMSNGEGVPSEVERPKMPNTDGEQSILPNGEGLQIDNEKTMNPSDENITELSKVENKSVNSNDNTESFNSDTKKSLGNEEKNDTSSVVDNPEANNNKTAEESSTSRKNGALDGKGAIGGKNSNGGDLKYIDDNADSYSAIKDNIIFKTTTDEDFNRVIEMIKNLNNGENLEEYLNVDGILRYFAVNTFLVNLDSYSGGMYHNYYLYEKDGVFDILPWDLNMSFAGFGVNDSNSAVNFPIDSPVKGTLENAPLINELLKVDEYKELYHGYLEKIVNEYVNNGTFENSVVRLDKLIGNYVKSDKTAFYTYEEYKKAIPELITFTKERATSVKAQLAGEQPTTETGNIKATANIKLLGDMGQGGGDRGNAKEEGEVPLDKNIMNGQFSMENIEKIKSLLENKEFSELTEEEKNILSDLGINSDNIDEIEDKIKNMFSRDKNKMINIRGNNGTINMNNYILSIGITMLLLLSSLLYVKKYKRKK